MSTTVGKKRPEQPAPSSSAQQHAPQRQPQSAPQHTSQSAPQHQPLVSVVIPMYNVADTLDQCLDSVESQILDDLQIICVNDGSPDDSSAIAHAHAARDARIEVIDKPNEGYGASCNRGIAAARGEWVAIVEPDDYLDPRMFDLLTKQAGVVRAGSGREADVVKCAYWRVFEAEGDEKRVSCPYFGRVKPASQPFSAGDGVELLLHHPAIWAGMYRRSFLEREQIRFIEVPGAGWADNPFLAQTLCATDAIAYVDEPLYYYREHDLNDAEALARKSPLTPLARWNDMMDAAERLGVEDDRVLDALALRGVNYAVISVSANGGELDAVPSELRELVASSMERLEPARVFGLAALSSRSKAFFAQVRGVEAPHGGRAARVRYLAGEAAYRLRSNGPGFLLDNVQKRLNRL